MLHRAARHVTAHFLPTKQNGFIPHLLRDPHVFALLGLGLSLFFFVQVARVTQYFGLTAEVYPAVVVTLTNQDRIKNNLHTLTVNDTLIAAAKLKAQDMATKGYFAHTSPEGVTPWYWFGRAGYKFIYAGENLAINFDETDAVQKAWLDSPTHRANIMNKNFTEMGVATATGNFNGVPTTFVVELFGMPATARAITPPAQKTPATTAPLQAPSTPTRVTTTTVTASEVAGQATAPKLTVLEETPTYTMAQNEDQTLEPGNPVVAQTQPISWQKRLVLNSDKIAGFIIQVIIIVAIITTAGMVAREYEKHHKKHMAYGALLVVIMFSFLFVGKMGVFANQNSGLATALSALEE